MFYSQTERILARAIAQRPGNVSRFRRPIGILHPIADIIIIVAAVVPRLFGCEDTFASRRRSKATGEVERITFYACCRIDRPRGADDRIVLFAQTRDRFLELLLLLRGIERGA